MSTSRKKSSPKSRAAAPLSTAAAASFELTAADRRFLGRVGKFLVNVIQPRYLSRAQREGYSETEHGRGIALRRRAAGEDRSLKVLFQSVRSAPESASLAALQQIDDFENRWFPRTRAIIERVVSDVTGSEEAATQFADAFFQDLAQQPIGPGVVASVSTYLRRVEALEKSRETGAREVLQTLRARGLEAPRLRAIQQLVETTEGARQAPAEIDAPELASARAQQMESLGALRRWFSDWSTTLRTSYNAMELQTLGLSAPGSRGPGAVDEEDEAEEPTAPEPTPAAGP